MNWQERDRHLLGWSWHEDRQRAHEGFHKQWAASEQMFWAFDVHTEDYQEEYSLGGTVMGTVTLTGDFNGTLTARID